MPHRRNPDLPTRDEIVRVLKAHPLVRLREKVKRAFVVGSGATGRQRPDSDIDILLEVPPVRGLSAGELTDRYRRKIQEYFVKRGIRGRADHLHPQWDGRRVDVYFTYCAEADIDGPAIELATRTANPRRGLVAEVLRSATAAALAACDLDNMEDINAGWCDRWAEIAETELRRAGVRADLLATVESEDAPFHVFLKIGARYYDAETLGGVGRLRDLPFFKRAAQAGVSRIAIEPW